MVDFILRLYRCFAAHRAMLWAGLLVVALMLLFAASRIRFREDISGFLAQGHDSDRINFAYQHVGAANKLMVSVMAADTAVTPEPDTLVAAVERFVALVTERDTAHRIKKLEYRTDPQMMLSLSAFITANMPYFFTDSDYQRIDSLLTTEKIHQSLENGKQMLSSPVGTAIKRSFLSDPLHLSAPLMGRLREFQADSRFNSYDDYLFTTDRRKAVIAVESAYPVSETRNNSLLMSMLDEAARITEAEFNQTLKIRYFGATDIALTNSRQIKKDSMISGIMAVILIFALLLFVFRSVRSLVIIFVSLLFGWLFAFGALALLKAEVDLIAVGIASIIMGIAVNYPLHLLDHYRHERDIRTVIRHVVAPLLIGNITTVGAFLSLLFIDSPAMRDLGLFASLLLAGTIIFVLIVVPHFRLSAPKKTVSVVGEAKVFAPERNRIVVWGVLALTIVFFFLSSGVKFESNMQAINYMTPEQRHDFDEMVAALNSDGETVYFVSEGANADKALSAYEKARPHLDSMLLNGELSRINGIGNFLPSQNTQKQRLALWHDFWQTHKMSIDELIRQSEALGYKKGVFDNFIHTLTQTYDVQPFSYFEPLSSSVANNYLIPDDKRYMIVTLLHTHKEVKACEETLAKIENSSFAFDAGSISRNIVNTLSQDFNKVLFICGFLVFAFLLFSLGRIELSLLAFLPLMIGWFWILGIMSLFNISFNIVNIILATLIFGQGDDYTIFITEGLMYEYAYGRKLLKSYKNSIALSALLMFIGIGSLIIAKHPALHSLAEVTIAGMLSVVLMTFIFPPLVFNWLTSKRGKKRRMAVTIKNIAATVYAFAFFLFGTLGITLAGFVLLNVGGRSERNKLRYHRILQAVSAWVMRHFPQAHTYIDNRVGETFEKPGVIIANHQSHIDLMCILMLHPKIIILTNDWVWKSPFYGLLIRYADFYPVSDGIENAVDRLHSAIERGYSIMLFPEGTRSVDCSIGRFHKGAFYLAEKLGVDVIPVLLHGLGHLLPKQEFMLRKGQVHVRIMPRITVDDTRFGTSALERSRLVRQYFREEYAQLASKVENAEYYRDMVVHNYLYKGPGIEKEVKRLLHHPEIDTIIAKATNCRRVWIQNCGYGALPLLLALVCKNCEVIASEDDEDLFALAANCAAVPANLHYTNEIQANADFDLIIDGKIKT